MRMDLCTSVTFFIITLLFFDTEMSQQAYSIIFSTLTLTMTCMCTIIIIDIALEL